MDDCNFLNDMWCLYFHDPFDEKYDVENYTKIITVSTINEFGIMYYLLKDRLHQGMFFLMREHIFPKWNDDENKNGGFLSIKILKDKVKSFCEKLFIELVNESLLKNEYIENWNLINGISISPKKHFCIIKIWLKNNKISNHLYYNIPDDYHGEIIYKDNTV